MRVKLFSVIVFCEMYLLTITPGQGVQLEITKCVFVQLLKSCVWREWRGILLYLFCLLFVSAVCFVIRTFLSYLYYWLCLWHKCSAVFSQGLFLVFHHCISVHIFSDLSQLLRLNKDSLFHEVIRLIALSLLVKLCNQKYEYVAVQK